MTAQDLKVKLSIYSNTWNVSGVFFENFVAFDFRRKLNFLTRHTSICSEDQKGKTTEEIKRGNRESPEFHEAIVLKRNTG